MLFTSSELRNQPEVVVLHLVASSANQAPLLHELHYLARHYLRALLLRAVAAFIQLNERRGVAEGLHETTRVADGDDAIVAPM
mmetsp:Transcript_1390/g.3943  ORF Transcript_1390/g.3943 Transcript_1390/m.3943 type:complete len:83 (+) Transcript_1390:286-534(+)